MATLGWARGSTGVMLVGRPGFEPGTKAGKWLNRRDLPAGVGWIQYGSARALTCRGLRAEQAATEKPLASAACSRVQSNALDCICDGA